MTNDHRIYKSGTGLYTKRKQLTLCTQLVDVHIYTTFYTRSSFCTYYYIFEGG